MKKKFTELEYLKMYNHTVNYGKNRLRCKIIKNNPLLVAIPIARDNDGYVIKEIIMIVNSSSYLKSDI